MAATPTDNFFAKALSLLVGPKVYGSTLFSKEKAITSPAYRVTVPAVVQVTLLRKTHQQATPQ